MIGRCTNFRISKLDVALSCSVLLCPALSCSVLTRWQRSLGLAVCLSCGLLVSRSLGLSVSRSLGLSVSRSFGLSVSRSGESFTCITSRESYMGWISYGRAQLSEYLLAKALLAGRADRASNVQNFSDGFIVTNSIYVACDV